MGGEEVEEVGEEVGRKCWTLHQRGSVYISESVRSYFNIQSAEEPEMMLRAVYSRTILGNPQTVQSRKVLIWNMHTA